MTLPPFLMTKLLWLFILLMGVGSLNSACGTGSSVLTETADQDADGSDEIDDCDDSDADVHPGASEVCGDAVDQDCNGIDLDCGLPPEEPTEDPTPAVDNDQDGVLTPTDCDDDDASIYPGAIETCDDTIDQDCDGEDPSCSAPPPSDEPPSDRDGDGVPDNDDVFPDDPTESRDADNDTFGDNVADCDPTSSAIYPGAPETCGDTIDQDCSGEDLSCDADNDGARLDVNDCNDNDASIYPGAYDVIGDLVDSDCDGIGDNVLDEATETIAGFGYGNGYPAIGAIIFPYAILHDENGNMYMAETGQVRMIDTSGITLAVAGNGQNGYTGDGGPAISARVFNPAGLAIDTSGNLYIADSSNNRIRKIDSNGTISTYAGTGTGGYSGDTGPANEAKLNNPTGIVFDSSDNLYIADQNNHCIRKIDVSAIITTVAGTCGSSGSTGDGGAATVAKLNTPYDIDLDTSNNLYISDKGNHRIRKVNSADQIITTIAGTSAGYFGDNGPATSAQLNSPRGISLDSAGALYIADTSNHRIRKVAAGIITTAAGTGTSGYSGDGGPATAAMLNNPYEVEVVNNTVYIVDNLNRRIRSIAADGTISTVVGNGNAGTYGDEGDATAAQVYLPSYIAVDNDNTLYIADTENHHLRKVDTNGVIDTIAGTGSAGYSGNGGSAVLAQLNKPSDMVIDSQGMIYFADTNNNVVRKITTSGIISTVAGGGAGSGENVPATTVTLSSPQGLTLDTDGNLYLSEIGAHRVRKVATNGIITTVAGTGVGGFSGDGGPATSAALRSPRGLAIDTDGNLYISDTANSRIRRVALDGTISTYAGTSNGYSGDGGDATAAQLNSPWDIALDRDDNLYIADYNNKAIRKVDTNGIITTLVGTGSIGYSEGVISSGTVPLNNPQGVAVDSVGTVYISDTSNHRIRMIDP